MFSSPRKISRNPSTQEGLSKYFYHTKELCLSEILARRKALVNGDFCKYPLGIESAWDKRSAEEVLCLADTFLKRSPQARFFGIGQSPAGLIHALKALAEQRGQEIEAVHVPFSGRFLRHQEGVYRINASQNTQLALSDNMSAYRNTLGRLGLSPTRIIEDYECDQKQTLLIDNTQSGTAFASFVGFLHLWAQNCRVEDRFIQATRIVALTFKRFNDCTSGVFDIPELQVRRSLDIIPISNDLGSCLNANNSAEQDRFIPSYPPSAWDKPPPALSPSNQRILASVKQLIEETAGVYEASPVRRARLRLTKMSTKDIS